jgi:16S rRNA (cytosine1402-N4)-methyltransferase
VTDYSHQSVLLEQAVAALVTDPGGVYIDGTFGRGGHASKILDSLSDTGRLLVIDKDPQAINEARRLQEQDPRLTVAHSSFADIEEIAGSNGVAGNISGVLLDLGVSSPQLDDASRGFSFSKDGPLDMRMNTDSGITAAQWLAGAREEEMVRVFFEFGEEKFSRRIARAIAEARKHSQITSTLALAEIVKQAHPAWEKHKRPATRVFQAIRIHINNELQDIEKALTGIMAVLKTGGRMVIISFHSLEDRLVKQFISKEERGDDFPPDMPVTQAQLNPRLKKVGRQRKAEAGEVTGNIRARSAVLRVAEKIA